jgi:hypothetical protein
MHKLEVKTKHQNKTQNQKKKKKKKKKWKTQQQSTFSGHLHRRRPAKPNRQTTISGQNPT